VCDRRRLPRRRQQLGRQSVTASTDDMNHRDHREHRAGAADPLGGLCGLCGETNRSFERRSDRVHCAVSCPRPGRQRQDSAEGMRFSARRPRVRESRIADLPVRPFGSGDAWTFPPSHLGPPKLFRSEGGPPFQAPAPRTLGRAKTSSLLWSAPGGPSRASSAAPVPRPAVPARLPRPRAGRGPVP